MLTDKNIDNPICKAYKVINKMKRILLSCGIMTCYFVSPAQKDTLPHTDGHQKTAFQTGSAWMPQIDVRSDVAIIYGVNGNPSDKEHKASFLDRVNSWRERGYQTDFMTGIAWGAYKDYFYGNWDGKMHLDQAQVAVNNDTVWHGNGIPYIVPVQPYINYFKTAIVKKVIDACITQLFFEEP